MDHPEEETRKFENRVEGFSHPADGHKA
jgi:hypothetical protein